MAKFTWLFFATLSILLTACAPFKPSDQRAAICNELNKKMIFTGSTANPRNAEIQTSEYELIQREYENNHCDK